MVCLLILSMSLYVRNVSAIYIDVKDSVNAHCSQIFKIWTYPLLTASGCSSPVGMPSDVKCFRNSLASSKAEEPFWLSLGPSRLSLEPGPNRPNLGHKKYTVDQIQYITNAQFYSQLILLTSSSVVSSAGFLYCGGRSSQANLMAGGKWSETLLWETRLSISHHLIWKFPSRNTHLLIRAPPFVFKRFCLQFNDWRWPVVE